MDTKDSKDQKVQGPISLTHHISTEYNKNVYVFGENHDTSLVCTDNKNVSSIDAFLDSALKTDRNSTKMIDIFIEQPHYKVYNQLYDMAGLKLNQLYKQYKLEEQRVNNKFEQDTKRYEEEYKKWLASANRSIFNMPQMPTKKFIPPPSMAKVYEVNSLYKLVNHFKTCFPRYNKESKCPYNNLRAHLIDVRHEGNKILYTLHDISKSITQDIPVISQSIIDKILNELNDLLKSITFSDNSLINKIKRETRITKNLANITDTKLADQIEKYFDTKLLGYGINNDMLAKLYQNRKVILDVAHEHTLRGSITQAELDQYKGAMAYLDDKLLIIRDFQVMVVDYYLITRMFRSFTAKSTGEYSQPPKDIIIYVGEAHARNYREFFKYLGLFEIEKRYSKELVPNIGNGDDNGEDFEVSYSCLDISKIKQPFFQ